MAATDMVAAKGWDSNRGLALLRSTDLLSWQLSAVHFPMRYPGQASLKRMWAPQTIYDEKAGKYLAYILLQYSLEPGKI